MAEKITKISPACKDIKLKMENNANAEKLIIQKTEICMTSGEKNCDQLQDKYYGLANKDVGLLFDYQAKGCYKEFDAAKIYDADADK